VRTLPLLFALAAAGCDGTPEMPDAGPEPMDVVFDAVPDPSERTDCATPPMPGEARAKHVACAAELITGPLAMGRIGDVVIENARVRFVVRTGDEGATIVGGPPGGVIDASSGGEDFLKELLPVFELDGYRATDVVVVGAGGTGEEARVRVLFESEALDYIAAVVPTLGRSANARGQIDYVLGAGDDALRIEIDVTTALGMAGGSSRPGILAFIGGAETVQQGYGLLTEDMPGGAGTSFVSDRGASALALALGSPTGTLLHVDTVHILQGERVTYRRGEVARVTARLAVGDTAGEAYRAIAPPGLASLVLDPATTQVVEIAQGGVALLRTRAFGAPGVPLPPGAYELRSVVPFEVGPPVTVVHGAMDTPHTQPAVALGTLDVSATVGGDATAPVRLTVERGGEELRYTLATGSARIALPAGPARVTVSHGLEFDVHQEDVTLMEGATTAVTAVLDRAIDTAGWASVDLHLHSELSTDSVHRVLEAVTMIAAEGVDAAASTDHDFVTDYPSIGAFLAGRVLLVAGEEVSTTVYGHVNGYPLLPDPSRSGAGAVPWFDLAPREVFDALRDRGDAMLGGALVQVNHPRLRGTAFFDRVALDATGHATADPTTLGLPAGTDLDDFAFDAIEVWNGYTRGDNERSFEDYLALTAAGRRFAMVGNSDSHRPGLPAGSPRSFVRVPDDAPGALAWTDVAAAIRARDVTVAAGVFVTAEVAGPRAGGTVPILVRAQAPPWVATDRLRIYAGRTVAIDRALTASTAPLRIDETIDVPIAATDDFVVVRVDGAAAPEPMQHFAPYGITNAIIVP
jgi:hypothetical protein